jgi:uncharacterized protein YjbJ (UPF0337 family)
MSGSDNANNTAQELGGEAKEAVDRVTGEERTEDEGESDQTKSNLKDAAEKAKDAAGPPADIALTDYPSPDIAQ